MRFTRILASGVTIAALAGTVVFAASHGGSDNPAVKARQAHMDLYAFNMGILGNMAKGAVDFDAEVAQAAASDLAGLSALSQRSYWPAGTSNADMEGTRALPAAWEDMAGTAAKITALNEAAVALAAAADTLDGVRANFGAVGNACSACHKVNRAPE